MFDKVLIANRGAIACRIIRTLDALGVGSVAVYSRADAASRHVSLAGEAVCIGEALAAESYLDMGRILDAAEATGAQAIHPGYGFLSENASFAETCEQRGLVFLGPTPAQLRDFGLKHRARELAAANAVPLLPGSGLLEDAEQARREAERIGYPVMLKSTAGGGGIGMQQCADVDALTEAFERVRRLGQSNFADAGIFLERYVRGARHIEVQIFGNGLGGVAALGERDCSLQRRNQKVVEETPAPHLPPELRAAMLETARRLGAAVAYRSAGTVEYIYDPERAAFYFLEVNTRLQVEHGVTEAVTGVDLVEWMVRLGAGSLPDLGGLSVEPQGHAIQVRLYAEDPGKGFQPSAGLLTHVELPPDVRVDTWIETGTQVSPYYDPLLAKVIVHAKDRPAALARLEQALERTEIAGIETNLGYLRQVMRDPEVVAGRHHTATLAGFDYRPDTIDVLAAGTQSTVQDWPGRLGYWDVGIPPSGPMDDLAFRLGNRMLGNPSDAAGLELTVTGPTLRFNRDARVCLTGAEMAAQIDGRPVPWWRPVAVRAGEVLRLGAMVGSGARAYLTVCGGLQVPTYLGSRATFTLGRFGGHGGRPLQVGDVLHLATDPDLFAGTLTDGSDGGPSLSGLPEPLIPRYGDTWTLRVIYGPHGAPEFFTDEDIATLFATDWEVHYNSSRTGVRLIGPKPTWARPDGGEAGLHPSNIHDNAYALGTLDFTGDMPVILGPDGPSLGGFVCPATVISADRWCLGQLRPGDRVRFVPVSQETANALEAARDDMISRLAAPAAVKAKPLPPADPRVRRIDPPEHPVGVTYRASGDKDLLVEYGPQVLDIRLRFRVHALMLSLRDEPIPGVLELTPGIRSLQVRYDSRALKLGALLDRLVAREQALGDVESLSVPARVVHLPLSWDDSSTRLAIEKYMQSVRPDAPWCPSNIEFIRRINGLDSIDDVRRILFEASYLVMGLGDVYLGAPVATPLDPRHRLVTTKYNPARTWTPENAVGIGGSYLCVYGMEGPGGYQFVGRTLQMWNRFKRTPDFERPYLLRFFDQIRFYPVSEQELTELREAFPRGGFRLQVEETRFSLAEYQAFLQTNAESIAVFKTRQQAAFEAERERWAAAGQLEVDQDVGSGASGHIDEQAESLRLAPGELAIESHVHGSVWQLAVEVGQQVEPGQVLLVLESMKMEIAVHADRSGRVARILCRSGAQVTPGQALLVLDTAADATEKTA
ncbi:urea carboxylase [Thiocapsa marina]|uniref:Biotin carboxylase n=1 Tax=Thiocapsa marina 5811 TaxID=768671 RepID=F9UBC7_9GAMM|nr:urea carboxylase [Thiocapsa marina]EGV18245.1 urea carboxylase [Thiocapsa marina 5811]